MSSIWPDLAWRPKWQRSRVVIQILVRSKSFIYNFSIHARLAKYLSTLLSAKIMYPNGNTMLLNRPNYLSKS